VWAKSGRRLPVIYKSKLGFKAIAVTGAINMHGEVSVVCAEDYSINVAKFLVFLQALRDKYDERLTLHIFLDNLRVHYSHIVREYCLSNRI